MCKSRRSCDLKLILMNLNLNPEVIFSQNAVSCAQTIMKAENQMKSITLLTGQLQLKTIKDTVVKYNLSGHVWWLKDHWLQASKCSHQFGILLLAGL